ncbi:DUF5682 family protein [Antribacter gilvus]|uniref:DUF5682 family protein n=1 Tax=Antribacter gilvus TaxID=2304675 RepID=UPI000F7A16D3|nr:DUF5682 family protein [Antribacter gilvus]
MTTTDLEVAGSFSAGAARAAWDAAPERLRRAAEAIGTLRARGIHLAPVRHHSPACAVAVGAAIEELRPSAVLIEGPEEYTALIPALLHEETRPPVAVLSLGDSGSGFYPLARFSPEWVALRAGHAAGAELAFVDRPWGERGAGEREQGEPGPGERGEDGQTTLMSERYLAHSETIAAVARRLGCRDHDEVWDHLFEARTAGELSDWRVVFDDVLAWAALARLDYEEAVLAADGSLDREARMSARVAEHVERLAGSGPVLVVTGAFHTLALVEALSGAPEGAVVRDRWPAEGYGEVASAEAWLVRYDHERLDGLRGYGAGMPTPGYYERLFAAHEADLAHGAGTAAGDGGVGAGPGVGVGVGAGVGRLSRRPSPDGPTRRQSTDLAGGGGLAGAAGTAGAAGASRLAVEVLVDVARAAADRGHAVSLPQVSAGAEQAVRLADLRGRPFPGRTDVLDAITSSFLQDDGGVGVDRPLGLAVAEVFGGRALGEVPPGSASPPLVRDARERVRQVRLTVDDSVPRTTRLDARRTPAHRARREVLALLDFVGSGFGRQVSGPDHVAGRGLGLLLEEWEYAWTPLVEARLVELSHLGATLDAVALARLRAAEARLAEVASGTAGANGPGAGGSPGGGPAAASGGPAAQAPQAVDGAATLMAQALVMGLGDHLPRLAALLRSSLDVDRDLASVVGGGQRLLHLWRARTELGAEAHAGSLLDLVGQSLATAAYLVPDVGRARPEDEDTAVATVVALRTLVREAARARPGAAGASRAAAAPGVAASRELARLREDAATAPSVRGALVALGSVDGEVTDDVLVARVRGALQAGADPSLAARFLGGVLRAAPDLLLHTPELFDAVDEALRRLAPEAFLAVLPDLRRAFTWLRPTETHRLAQRVAASTGVRAHEVDVRVDLTEQDLAAGLVLERELAAVLARDGLARWSGAER